MTELKHYFAPTSLDQAVECLKDGDVTILAGGTDLTPQSQAGRLKIKQTLMNIRHIPQLSGITLEGKEIRIGALTTITEIMEHPLIRERLPVLVVACDHFASDQIRNAGTIGGNICNASPAGDMLIPLLVLDACVELASMPENKIYRHCMPLSTFFVGPGKTRKSLCELVTSVRIPLPAEGHVAHFYKHGTRPALDISTISIGVAGTFRDGTLSNVRVAFGAVAPTPVRASQTEQALEGQRLDEATIEKIAQIARDEVKPIDDVRATAWYRKEMIHNITKRILSHVAQA
ncbi:MAG: xanthine dehydrogenase family protein subunit M [Burkholderiaceae bacterium]|nr:xanthine dehydrogenase family protein subunit M [Sulfuritalea sp.]MCF8174265.1 xanthine dehydrogenase family protein subunit M [Burkholderiaceae bacterium]MCF8185074.1 xanthine dehydrogenase family protein subunit M [Polynucleobacter sp.]